MTKTLERGRMLSDNDLQSVLELAKASDSVELKLSLPEADQRSTLVALGIDPLDAQIRQVFFMDTPDLILNQAGIVVRARRVQGRSGDSTIKLRPVVPSEIPSNLRRMTGFGVEVDAMPGGYVCSASLKAPAENQRIKAAASGEVRLRKLFSREQRDFYRGHAPDDIDLDSLTVLGPIFVLKEKWVPTGAGRPMTAEMWLYPDGSRFLEISLRCMPRRAFQIALETRVYLHSLGIDLSGEQETKTRKALEHFTQGTPAAHAI